MVFLDVSSVVLHPHSSQARELYLTSRYSNIPAGVLVIATVFFFVPFSNSSTQQSSQLPLAEKLRHLDPIGTLIFLGAVVCLLLALTWGGQTYAWNNGRIIGLFVGFGVLVICLCFWLVRQGEKALIPLRILCKRSIAMSAITLFGFGLAMNVVSTSSICWREKTNDTNYLVWVLPPNLLSVCAGHQCDHEWHPPNSSHHTRYSSHWSNWCHS